MNGFELRDYFHDRYGYGVIVQFDVSVGIFKRRFRVVRNDVSGCYYIIIRGDGNCRYSDRFISRIKRAIEKEGTLVELYTLLHRANGCGDVVIYGLGLVELVRGGKVVRLTCLEQRIKPGSTIHKLLSFKDIEKYYVFDDVFVLEFDYDVLKLALELLV